MYVHSRSLHAKLTVRERELIVDFQDLGHFSYLFGLQVCKSYKVFSNRSVTFLGRQV